MSKSFMRYAVIYKTNIVHPIKPIVNDPVRLEVFTSARKYIIPAQISRIFDADTGGVVGGNAELKLEENTTYIEIVVRTKDRDPLTAQVFCEEEANRYVAMLSLLYSVDIFDQLIYRGWVLDDGQQLISAWLKGASGVTIDSNELSNVHAMIRALEANDTELLRRFLLMSKFYARSAVYDPGDEKFLFLWTILEVYPMMGTPKGKTNIKSISQYLAPILGRSEEEVFRQLDLGAIYGMRSSLVHAGQLQASLRDLSGLTHKLESIVRTILRKISGLEYQGDLDAYFN